MLSVIKNMTHQPKRQVVSLKLMSENQVVCNILELCYELDSLKNVTGQKYTNAIEECHKYYGTSMTLDIHRSVLEKCTEKLYQIHPETQGPCDGHKNVLPHLFNAILNSDIKELKVLLCCYGKCEHKTALYKTLTENGRGLVSLELSRSTMTCIDSQLFQSMALSMSNLTHLVLKGLACDNILKVIGKSCFKLNLLDISESYTITNIGVKELLQIEIDSIDEERLQVTTGIPWWQSENIFKNHKHDEDVHKKITSLMNYCRNPTELCSTLHTLNIAYTGVTDFGMAIAVLNIKNLKSLGDQCNVGKVIELLFKHKKRIFELQLETINMCHTTSAKLLNMCYMCKNFKKLVIKNPLNSPYIFSHGYLPHTLTKLHLTEFLIDSNWLECLHTFLAQPALKVLQELILKCSVHDETLLLRLGLFLFQLRDLEILIVEGIDCSLESNNSAITLNKLEKVCIGKINCTKSLECLLKCTPFLEVLHIYSCTDLNSSNLQEIIVTDMANPIRLISKYIKCIYIDELPGRNSKTIKILMKCFPEINSIGNVFNWDLSKTSIHTLTFDWLYVKHIDLTLHDHMHWSCSDCFPNLKFKYMNLYED